jgi:hypothetical protein
VRKHFGCFLALGLGEIEDGRRGYEFGWVPGDEGFVVKIVMVVMG